MSISRPFERPIDDPRPEGTRSNNWRSIRHIWKQVGRATESFSPPKMLTHITAPAYLLIYGSLPTISQFEEFHREVMHHGVTHADAEQFCRSFRYDITRVFCACSNFGLLPASYDAHPMAILTSAFAYLGSYYREANPSLQGAFFSNWCFTSPDPCRLP